MAKVNPVQESEEQFVDELKPGSKLLHGQYTIERFLNAGGFGITYLARNSLDRVVVIKECFPGNFCRRTQNIVTARSRAHEAQFAHIVRLFVQEAKSLSRLVHPNIVGVHQVFEENDTAYMAIDYVDGRDLLEIIENDRAKLTPSFVVTILKKLLGAVAFIHDNGMLHRDISPDNIHISRSGEPILIDFGAARQQATRVGGKALSALRVVKDGYSPQEFYVAGSNQSASSDLYALAATFHHLISGEIPPSSQARLVAIAEGSPDPYKPLAGRFPGYPPGFLAAIDKAMNILPKDRLPSARAWLDLIAPRPELKVVPLDAPTQAVPAPAAPSAPAPSASAADHAEAPAAPATQAVALSAPRGRPGRGLRLIAAAGLVVAAAALVPLAPGVLDRGAAPPLPLDRPAQTGSPMPSLQAEPAAATATQAPAPAGTQTMLPHPLRITRVGMARAGTGAMAALAGLLRTDRPVAEAEAALSGGVLAGPADAVAAPFAAAIVDPAVLPRQVAAAAWTVELPFRTAATASGGRFPVIAELLPGAQDHEANAWIAEGVTIYAVDGRWVNDEATLRAAVEAQTAEDGRSHVLIAARIRRSPAAAFEEVTLAVPVVRDVTLLNGVRTRTVAVGGTWRGEVVAVPATMGPDAPATGDVIVAERTTGARIDGPTAIETIVSALGADHVATAEFIVLRGGAEVRALMPLARRE
jgi:hypothetical protein